MLNVSLAAAVVARYVIEQRWFNFCGKLEIRLTHAPDVAGLFSFAPFLPGVANRRGEIKRPSLRNIRRGSSIFIATTVFDFPSFVFSRPPSPFFPFLLASFNTPDKFQRRTARISPPGYVHDYRIFSFFFLPFPTPFPVRPSSVGTYTCHDCSA